MESLAENGRAVRAAAFVTTTPGDDVVRVAAEQNVDLVVVDPLGDIGAGLSGDLATVLEGAPAMSACSSRRHTRRCRSRSCRDRSLRWRGARVGGARDRRVDCGRDWSTTRASRNGGRSRRGSEGCEQVARHGIARPPAGGGSHGRAEACARAAPRPRSKRLATQVSRWSGYPIAGVSTASTQTGLPSRRGAVTRAARARGVRPGGLAPDQSLTRFTWTIAPAS